ncbi:MAG: restriction endonuclease subunit S [Flavobacteriaceae bacterium]|nr:restriction endonuclease subunit S [Flavobacteriaceae bacterium]
MKKLSELCKTGAGGTPLKSRKDYYINGNIPWLRSGEVNNKNITKSELLISEKGLNNSSAKLFPKNTVLVAMYGATAGQVGILRFESSTNQAVCGILPNGNIIPEFIYYKFLEGKEELVKQAVGGAQPNISQIKIKNTLIPAIPLPEQQRIVAVLDQAFTAIATAKENAQQNLLNAKALFESYLQNVFENKGDDSAKGADRWEEKRLDEVCEITSKLIDPKESQYQDLIHIGAGNIISEKGTLIDLKTAKEENLISGKFLFDESMVLYSKIRPYLMKIVKCEFKGLCSADIYPLVPFKDKMTQPFLYHLLSSNHFTEYAIEGSQRAGMPKVNRKHLFEYSFSLPPIKEQQQIVKKLNSLSAETKKLEAIYQQKINDLEELKKSVLDKAFKGEL